MQLGRITDKNYEAMEEWFPKEMREVLEDPDYYCYGAYEPEKEEMVPLGVAIVHINVGDGLEATFPWFYVGKEHRGKGVGTFLLSAIRERLEESGCVQMTVLKSNLDRETAEFFLQHGFDDQELEDDYLLMLLNKAPLYGMDGAGASSDPNMANLLPRFYRLKHMLSGHQMEYEEEMDEEIGPYVTIQEDAIRIYLALSEEDTETYAFVAETDILLSDAGVASREEILSRWQQMADLTAATVEEAQDVVTLTAFYPMDDPEETDDNWFDFLESYRSEIREFRRIVEVG